MMPKSLDSSGWSTASGFMGSIEQFLSELSKGIY
jgi:hypothetical protein